MDGTKHAGMTKLSEICLVIPLGSLWTHYKKDGSDGLHHGVTYQVTSLSVKEDTGEPLVSYRSTQAQCGWDWTRTVENFLGDVSEEDLAKAGVPATVARPVRRFSRVR